MFETVYGILKKNAVIKDENDLKVLIQNTYAYSGSSTPLIFATRKTAKAKLETYYENIRNDYKVVRLEFSFPDGYFKVSSSPTAGVIGNFAHLNDAIVVATGLDGWRGDANIYFVERTHEPVFVSVADWKIYQEYKVAKEREMYLLRNSSGALVMNDHKDTKKILEMITLT